ncbi:MAG: hypothetical protein ACAI35_11325 [Candidatus Methylacidiphilales bacterium]|nr:Amuc_1100 family pilus-like protein [Candidatus Methylacidiphilales bacterium]
MKLSNFDIGMIVVFAVLGVAGIGGYIYTSGDLEEATTKATVAEQTVADLRTRGAGKSAQDDSGDKIGITNDNLVQLGETIKKLSAGLEELAKTHFLKGGNPLAAIKAVDGTEFKQNLDRVVARLTKDAKANRVGIPAGFYFGFSRYIPNTPSQQHTVILQKQLLALSEISDLMVKAKVDKIEAVRRTMEEDGASNMRGSADNDSLKSKVTTGEYGYYVVYPFEVKFQCRNIEELRSVVNGLVKSDRVYVIRTIKVKTSKDTTVRMNELKSSLNQDTPPAPAPEGGETATPPAPAPAGGTTAVTPAPAVQPKSERGPVDIFGTETYTVDLRVDLIEWTGKANTPTAPGTTRPNPSTP